MIMLASCIVSIKTWASAPARYLMTSASSRSEKMDVINPTCSSAERGGLINCFHKGGLLDVGGAVNPNE